MSELFDKQVNAQKEKLVGFMQAPATLQKMCNKNETNKEEKMTCHKN